MTNQTVQTNDYQTIPHEVSPLKCTDGISEVQSNDSNDNKDELPVKLPKVSTDIKLIITTTKAADCETLIERINQISKETKTLLTSKSNRSTSTTNNTEESNSKGNKSSFLMTLKGQLKFRQTTVCYQLAIKKTTPILFLVFQGLSK